MECCARHTTSMLMRAVVYIARCCADHQVCRQENKQIHNDMTMLRTLTGAAALQQTRTYPSHQQWQEAGPQRCPQQLLCCATCTQPPAKMSTYVHTAEASFMHDNISNTTAGYEPGCSSAPLPATGVPPICKQAGQTPAHQLRLQNASTPSSMH
jgi:hypothetical protein